MKVAPAFASVAHSGDTAYVLTADRRLVRTNDGWHSFATANAGESVLSRWTRGTCIDEAIAPTLRDFYARAFDRVLDRRAPWHHLYECSSATTFRKFRMSVYPTEGDFLLVVHARIVETPHDGPAFAASSAYEVEGVVTVCAHCRKTRHPGAPVRWDWVPQNVESPPANLSHGLCDPCAFYHHEADLGPP